MLRRLAVALAVSSAMVVGSPAHAQLRLGGEFQVGTGTLYAHDQFLPSVGSDPDGNFVVAWSSYRSDGAGPRLEVRGERFSPSGAPRGSGEFQVSSYTSAYDIFPSVATDAAGNFVVVWSRFLGSGPSFYGDIEAQRFNAQGGKIGAEFQVNTTPTYTYYFVRTGLASDPAGNFVVSWMNADGDFLGVAARKFDANGVPLGPEFQVNTYTTLPQGLPSVAMDATGNFVVTWSQFEAAGEKVMGQRFDATTARLGAEFQINTFTTSEYSQIAMRADGSFAVTWIDRTGPASVEVRERAFDATAVPRGPEFLLASFTTSANPEPMVAMDESGDFTVVWRDPSARDGAGSGVFAHEMAPLGDPVGVDFQVNTFTTSNQGRAAIAASPAGKFVVVWDNYSNSTVDFQQFGFALERTHLRYGVVRNGGTLTSVTPPQNVMITIGGVWTAASDQPFVTVTPSGSGSGFLNIQVVNGAGLPTVGAASQATITVTSVDIPLKTQAIKVDVQVYAPGATTVPFGFFDTPANGAMGITGAIAVTGWGLDDVGVTGVQIWRDPVAGETPAPNGKMFIGDATFVSEARPDVEAAHPTYPLSYRAAWGYMLLTNLLPNTVTPAPAGGVGTFSLYAYMYDLEGHATVLGPHAITVDDTTATKPFGTIDTPASGQLVSGAISNFGWVLTPQTATIPTNGSTIQLFVDGTMQFVPAAYNAPRSDIATLFPGYNNSGGPVGAFTVDTSQLANGVHTMFWIVTDDQNRADGIGSRFFTVLN